MIAYVFVRRSAPGFMGNLPGLPPVTYASPSTGPFSSLVKVRVADVPTLHRFLEGPFASAGAIDFETAIPLRMGPRAPRVKIMAESANVEAIVRVSTEPGAAISVMKDAHEIEGVWGSAVVAGAFDVLLTAYARTQRGLLVVLGQIAAVDHVRSTATLLLSDQAFARPERGEA